MEHKDDEAYCIGMLKAKGGAHDEVHAPMHYEGDGVVDCDRAWRSASSRAAESLTPYQIGWWMLAFRYVWRWPFKHQADKAKDLRKARECIGKLIESIEGRVEE